MGVLSRSKPPANHAGSGTFPKREVMLERRQGHPLLRAITVVENRMGLEYGEMGGIREQPLFEALLVCKKDTLAGFKKKAEWLKRNFGLVPAEAGEGWERWMEKELGIPPNEANVFWKSEGAVTLVYEDERVEGEDERMGGKRKGAWRVGLSIEDGETSAYFRFWDNGAPQILGEDTMADAVRRFQEKFKPDGIYQVGRNYKIEIDWKLVDAMDSYPIKRFPQPEGPKGKD